MRRAVVIHPLLCGVFPVVSLVATNIHQVVVDARVVVAAAVAALLVGAGFLALNAWLEDRHKAGLVASAWALVLIFRGLDGEWLLQQPSVMEAGDPAHMVALWLIIPMGLTALVLRARGDMERWTRVANAAALFLVLFPALKIGHYEVRRWQNPPVAASRPAAAPRPAQPATREYPSIYYIVLDRYASASTLAESFGFDNGDILRYLRAKGFYVAEESRSNYLKTALSLASSLNMGYLDDINGATLGPNDDPFDDMDDLVPLYGRLQQHQVGQFLQARGYRYIHIGPLFQPTMANPHADENYCPEPKDLARTPWLRSLLRDPSLPSDAGIWWSRRNGLKHWVAGKYQFHTLEEVAGRRDRQFVFAHILVPHSPYVFDRDGRYVPVEVARHRPASRSYLEQLKYANTQVKRIVDQLLSDPENPAVVILQADEGPFPERYAYNQRSFDWHTATKSELRMKTGILNAYHIPGASGHDGLYPSITPVNSFRVVFNHLFGTGFPKLPDTVYAFRDGKHLYDFFDVTARVRDTNVATAGMEPHQLATGTRKWDPYAGRKTR
jgi:hypothetical protein